MGTMKTIVCLTLVVLTGAIGARTVFWAAAAKDSVHSGRCVNLSMCYASEPEPQVEEKPTPILPVVQQTSQPVREGDLEFQIVAESIWPMPARIGKCPPEQQLCTGESPVQFQLKITNHGNKAINLLSVVGTPILQSVGGKELEVNYFGNDHICSPKLATLEAGKTLAVKGFAQLYAGGRDSTCLWWEDEFGTNWHIDGLKTGKYLLKLQYNTRQHAEDNTWVKQSEAWFGNVRTAEIPIDIVDLKASQPAVFDGVEAKVFADGTWEVFKAAEHGWKDQIEATGLTDSTWQVPAAGEFTQVCLGFRMATVEDWSVRIIPSISMVKIKSADGVELPVRKTGATVSVDAPQLLGLQPEFTKSLAKPAILFHAGKSLTLAWADGAGNVWHVDSLKPGRYSVRSVIWAEKGEPQHISYWVGEIQTAPITIEIKE